MAAYMEGIKRLSAQSSAMPKPVGRRKEDYQIGYECLLPKGEAPCLDTSAQKSDKLELRISSHPLLSSVCSNVKEESMVS